MKRQLVGLAVLAALVVVAAPAAATRTSLAGTWKRLPAAPISVDYALVSVWTGREVVVFGRDQARSYKSANVAAAYDPATGRWRKLSPPAGPPEAFAGHTSAVWTGREMLVWGAYTAYAFTPSTNSWRELPRPPTAFRHPGGIVVWTGKEMVGWGGGCCGDAFDDGAAYNPRTNAWRKLPRAPIAGRAHPVGVWTGRELLIFGGRDPDGHALSGGAYDPQANRWRRMPGLTAARSGDAAVWTGREALLVGGVRLVGRRFEPTPGWAYAPGSGRWRRLARPANGRVGAAVVWTGRRLLAVGGQTIRRNTVVPASRGLAFDRAANRWSTLPPSTLGTRTDTTAVWTSRGLFTWGGLRGVCGAGGRNCRTVSLSDGALFRPAS